MKSWGSNPGLLGGKEDSYSRCASQPPPPDLTLQWLVDLQVADIGKQSAAKLGGMMAKGVGGIAGKAFSLF